MNTLKHLSGDGLPVLSKILGWLFSLINFLIPKDSQMVIFDSFYGTQYSDSPKVIYEQMLNATEFDGMQLFWTFVDPSISTEVPSQFILKKNSLKYLYYMCRSKFWISNSDIERLYGTTISKRGHFYINTWHGIPLKYLGRDEHSITKSTLNWFNKVDFDLLTASSDYDYEIFCHIFPSTKKANIQKIGLPRNDRLVLSRLRTEKIKQRLGIEKFKCVVLYAPTYRDNDVAQQGKMGSNTIADSIDTDMLSDETVILIRGHYFEKWNNKKSNHNVVNVSEYADINDLYLVADVLISDYSSVIFDYALLDKPIYLYTYDLNDYTKMRGMYRKIADLGLPVFESWSDLITSLNDPENVKRVAMDTKRFKNEYVGENHGCATETILTHIKRVM